MIVLGIDPDTTHTGVGLIKDGRAIYAKLVEVPNRKAKVRERILRMIDAVDEFLADFRINHPEGTQIGKIVVEGQRHRTNGKARAQDMIHLAQVAGAIAGSCRSYWPGIEIEIPEPQEWKGSVKKAIFTRRVLKDLGLELSPRGGIQYTGSKTVVRVPGTTKLAEKDSSHPIDGLGLAHWGYLRTPLRSLRR